MKINKQADSPRRSLDRIERELWHSGRSFSALGGLPKPGQGSASGGEPFVGNSGWQEGVMAEIRALGPLPMAMPHRTPRSAGKKATLWAWAAAVAACLVIGLAGYAFNNLTADAVIAGLFLDDPAGLIANPLWVEL
ncbi:MAG: hypothetical protein HYV36_00510 [Lentisphaerae bacterium]|nr:hypothetical protein [Lentisphaerota bacterium]